MVSRPDFKPRVPPYNSLIQFFVTTKPDRQRALHYYDLLVKAGVHPSAHTYKLLLDAYGTVGDIPDLEAMQQVFARLVKDKKVVVSGAHWASLVTAYGVTAKDVDRAITIFESIATHPTSRNNPTGPLPDAVVYEALLNALIANGRAELSDKYLAEMRDKGVRMTAYVANTLIKVRFCFFFFPPRPLRLTILLFSRRATPPSPSTPPLAPSSAPCPSLPRASPRSETTPSTVTRSTTTRPLPRLRPLTLQRTASRVRTRR